MAWHDISFWITPEYREETLIWGKQRVLSTYYICHTVNCKKRWWRWNIKTCWLFQNIFQTFNRAPPMEPLFKINPLNANPVKWSNTFKQFVGKLPTNYLSLFDHFVGLAFKGLTLTKLDLFQEKTFRDALKKVTCFDVFLTGFDLLLLTG